MWRCFRCATHGLQSPRGESYKTNLRRRGPGQPKQTELETIEFYNPNLLSLPGFQSNAIIDVVPNLLYSEPHSSGPIHSACHPRHNLLTDVSILSRYDVI
jgi:hypothetical protein